MLNVLCTSSFDLRRTLNKRIAKRASKSVREPEGGDWSIREHQSKAHPRCSQFLIDTAVF